MLKSPSINEVSNTLPRIAVAGEFQIGKSSFINALLKSQLTLTGCGISTTHHVYEFCYGEKDQEHIEYLNAKGKTIQRLQELSIEHIIPDKTQRIKITLNEPILKACTLFDLPGFNSVNNFKDTELSESYLSTMDYVIVLIKDGQSLTLQSETYTRIIRSLETQGIPYSIVLNPHQSYPEGLDDPGLKMLAETSAAILEQTDSKICYAIAGEKILCLQVLWRWATLCETHGYKDDFALSRFKFEPNVETIRKEENINNGSMSRFDIIRNFFKSDDSFSLYNAPTLARFHQRVDCSLNELKQIVNNQ